MPKILYVEDNDDNLYMLALRFEVLDGYEIITASDGAEGVAKAHAEKPDLILMDLNLPVMDGWEATRQREVAAEPTTCKSEPCGNRTPSP